MSLAVLTKFKDWSVRHFPGTSEVGPFGPAFLKLMFMCAELERRVADLQDAITGTAGFSEQNQWGTHDRPRLMRKPAATHVAGDRGNPAGMII